MIIVFILKKILNIKKKFETNVKMFFFFFEIKKNVKMLMSKYTVYTNLFMFDYLLNKQTQAPF